MRDYFALLLIATLSLIGCSNNPPITNEEPWHTATPEQQGFDSEVLLGLLQRIDVENLDIHSVVLMRDNKIFFEFYNYPYGPDTLHHSASVGKSVLSALTGIALEQGHLSSLEVPILESFPEYKTNIDDPRKADITLFNALTMTTGLDIGDDNPEAMSSIHLRDNYLEATWDQPMASNPGDSYSYSSFGSHLIASVTQRGVGGDLMTYAQSELFEPLGINEILVDRDPQGNWFGKGSLWMKPRDMLRFGQMYLNEGSWQGEQIVPSSWVKESTRNQIGDLSARDLSLFNARYGYQWWVFEGAYAAIGSGGQWIFIVPSLDFVAVITRATDHTDLIGKYIMAALKSSWFPARANPEAQAEVKQLINKLAAPRPAKAIPWPSLASEISGRRYEVLSTDDNESQLGITAFTLQFNEESGTASARFESAEGTELIELGHKNAPALSKASVGTLRPDSKSVIAATGWWLSGTQFAMDTHEVGFPLKARWHMTFDNNTATVSIKFRGAANPEYAFSTQANPGS